MSEHIFQGHEIYNKYNQDCKNSQEQCQFHLIHNHTGFMINAEIVIIGHSEIVPLYGK